MVKMWKSLIRLVVLGGFTQVSYSLLDLFQVVFSKVATVKLA